MERLELGFKITTSLLTAASISKAGLGATCAGAVVTYLAIKAIQYGVDRICARANRHWNDLKPNYATKTLITSCLLAPAISILALQILFPVTHHPISIIAFCLGSFSLSFLRSSLQYFRPPLTITVTLGPNMGQEAVEELKKAKLKEGLTEQLDPDHTNPTKF
jgi:hypothetical protein